MQSAKASPRPPKASGLAKTDIAFRWEPFSQVFSEVAPLTFRNFNEAGSLKDVLPFDPDWERYFQFEDSRILHVLTARKKGEMVGYVACLVLPHIQHRLEPCCTVNSIYLHPDHRAGTLGIRMLKRAMADLEAKGVKLYHIAARQEAFGHILKRLGFAVEETVYVKYAGVK